MFSKEYTSAANKYYFFSNSKFFQSLQGKEFLMIANEEHI